MDTLTTIRVAIISDTHGRLDQRIAELVTSCDIAVHAGDIMGSSVLHQLRPRSGNVITVRGNNDIPGIWHQDEHHVLQDIEHEANFDLPGGSVAVVHGHRHGGAKPDHQHLRETFPHARLIVYGHSHHMICDTESSPWVVNPGAAGYERTHGGPSCIVLEASNSNWQLFEHRFSLEINS